MEVVLRVTSGPHAGQEYLLKESDSCVVGRSSHVRFSMHEDPLLSREHFRVDLSPPNCTLVDLGSTNGTKVNGRRIESTPLRDGDVITAGDSAFVIRVERTHHNGKVPVHCLGCGRQAPESVILDPAAGPNAEIWLCEPCNARRNQFPATHPDYLIERRIGQGGMGEVYLARQLSINRLWGPSS